MNGETSNTNNSPQNDRVSDDAAKSLQNILNSVRTSVENEFAIQQMEYEELYGVDSQEYETYLNKVGSWLKANKLIDMVMDLLPISLVMDMATSGDSMPGPDPNISPTLPSMPIPAQAQQMDPQVQEPAAPAVQAPAPQAPPAPDQVAPPAPWGAPPQAADVQNQALPPVSDDSIPAITDPNQVQQAPAEPIAQPANVTPELDSIFPEPQPQMPASPQEVPQEAPQASPHEMAAQKSAYIPNNAWQSSDPELQAPSMPMPPPPPPKPAQESAPVQEPGEAGMDIPDDQFESAESDAVEVPPEVPPIPPKMPPPPPPKTQAPPSVPFMPPSPPPKNASAIPDESMDLFDELRQSQAEEAQNATTGQEDGFQSGTWANQTEQETPNAQEVLNAPQETESAQAPASGWEQVGEQPQDTANTWAAPPGQPQPPPPPPKPSADNAWEQTPAQPAQPEAQPADNPWGAPQPQAAPQPAAQEAPPQPAQPADNPWGAPQPQAAQPQPAVQEAPPQPAQSADNPWGAPQSQAAPPQPAVQEAPPQPAQSADNPWGAPQPQAAPPQPAVQQAPPAEQNAWGAPQAQAPPQNGQNGDPKKEEKEGDSFVFDPSTAWG